MKYFKKINCLVILIAVIFSSCSKDDAPTKETTTTALTISDLASKIPNGLETKTPQTAGAIGQMIAMINVPESFQKTKPTAKTTGKSGTETWVSDGFTINYTSNNTATQQVFTYTIKQDNYVFYTISGWVNLNGSAGHWVMNMDDAATGLGDIKVAFDWAKNSSNDYKLDMIITGAGEMIQMLANINHDKSGNLKYFFNGSQLIFESSWNANGSGQFIDYETDPKTVTKF